MNNMTTGGRWYILWAEIKRVIKMNDPVNEIIDHRNQ